MPQHHVLCHHPLSCDLIFLLTYNTWEYAHINYIPPRATFQWKLLIYNTTLSPPSFFWCLPFAGKLLIIPTSPRSRPTRSVALPAKCWQCKISASATTRTLHTYIYCLQIVKMQLHVYWYHTLVSLFETLNTKWALCYTSIVLYPSIQPKP